MSFLITYIAYNRLGMGSGDISITQLKSSLPHTYLTIPNSARLGLIYNYDEVGSAWEATDMNGKPILKFNFETNMVNILNEVLFFII